MRQREPTNQLVQQWNNMANLRTDLLHLQFLYASLSSDIEEQNKKLDLHHKDRLIQLYSLHKQHKEYSQSNWKILLITKIQSLIALYGPIDSEISERLGDFMNLIVYLQEQISRDLGRAYIGHKTMVDLLKCEKQMIAIEEKIQIYLKQNEEGIQLYKKRLSEIEELKIYMKSYLQEIKNFKNSQIDPQYSKHLKKRVEDSHKMTQKNINKLKQAILS